MRGEKNLSSVQSLCNLLSQISSSDASDLVSVIADDLVRNQTYKLVPEEQYVLLSQAISADESRAALQ